MKKILLIILVAIAVGSCSADMEGNDVQYDNSATQKTDVSESTVLATRSCFINLSAQVSVNLSNGLGNPVVVFTPVISGSVPATTTYRVRVEVQPLSDCDDMNSNKGSLLTFGPSGTVQNVIAVPPSISVLPGSMPLCYKWRFVFEGISASQKLPFCNSASIWYESPLF